VYAAENGRAHVSYTAVYTIRYIAVYGRVDGRFQPCRWPVQGLVHVDT